MLIQTARSRKKFSLHSLNASYDETILMASRHSAGDGQLQDAANVMLEDWQLEQLFSDLRIPDSARALVRRARAEFPARPINSHRGNTTVDFYSRKMAGRHLRLARLTVDSAVAEQYEDDTAVLEYWPHAVRSDLRITASDGHAETRISHLSDFLLIRRDSIILVDWRDECRLQRSASESDQFYQDENARWHYRNIEQHFRDLGLQYELHSTIEIPRILVDNIRFLRDYHAENCPPVDDAVEIRLKNALSQRGTIPFHELISDYGFLADDIFKAIIKKSIYVDLYRIRLSDSNDLNIHRDATVCRVRALIEQSEENPQLPFPGMGRLKGGSVVQFNNRPFRVVLVSGDKVLLRGSNNDIVSADIDLVAQVYDDTHNTTIEGDPPDQVGDDTLAEFDEAKLARIFHERGRRFRAEARCYWFSHQTTPGIADAKLYRQLYV